MALFGLFASISLALNIVLIVASLSALGSTLTLPGIAGIVLTIGMAVDANVLIYERIREEHQSRKVDHFGHRCGLQARLGHDHRLAFDAAHCAIVLYFLGSGPVQGFAVTPWPSASSPRSSPPTP